MKNLFARHEKYGYRYGWTVSGVEPSLYLENKRVCENLEIFTGTLKEFSMANQKEFDCITLNNVLEHIPDPIKVLTLVKGMLSKNGYCFIMVPNDFNVLQLAVNEKMAKDHYWILDPEHANYFTFKSLEKMLLDLEFNVNEITCDFPMEFFLLMGDNYIDMPELGPVCHKKRVAFESNMPTELRRELYAKFAQMGLGRNIMILAQKSF